MAVVARRHAPPKRNIDSCRRERGDVMGVPSSAVSRGFCERVLAGVAIGRLIVFERFEASGAFP